ncbi:MAG: MFS transporter [Candidatus Micrarchaeales archaeon]|jgi:EmrB/QacA subfamily drug resistance transporter|uniref:Major facilitator superfamily MFS_1 n=1 Tax=Candidatus Micrarchaeum acidiphilum ARMAN-2 TaxID=425595 RepID=C7DGW1_MICA2|nr:MAG: major facilitator superfamily MFS_1 [Candidatus Micrarchaeum acidiphilum ARMAN-2]MCW6161488.1 MFS transporter [Candidatus Micrarchaeales archaeon]
MQDAKPKENLILLVVVIGTLMASIDSTIVLLAFPAITQALHSTISTIIWVILAYIIVVAVLSTQLGRIGDIYGRAKMFNLGFAIFTIASFLCGIAPTDVTLILFRIVQAVGGALISSNSGAIIADTFDRSRIGRAYGFTSMSWNIGALLGIVLGGVITTFIGYRYIFFINVPIGIFAVALGIKYLKDRTRTNERVDLIGMALLGAAIALISYSGIEYASVGANAVNSALFTIGVLLAIAFVLFDRKAKMPTINFSMFHNKVLRNSMMAALFQGLGFMGVTFLLIMYLQGVRGYTPLIASLILLPGYVVSGILSPIMGRYSDRYGARNIATIGIAFMVAGVAFYILFLGVSSPVYYVVLGTIITGFGGAMFWPSNNSAVMANVRGELRGAASGTLRLFGNMGLIGSFVIAFVAAASAMPRYLAFEVFAGISKVIGGVGRGFVNGMHAAFITLILMLALAGLFSFIRGREDRSGSVEAEHKGKSLHGKAE